MKTVGILLLLVLSVALNAKQMVIVSILPQKTFVQKIAKEKIDVTVMVKPGSSPHSYEPKPSQMLAISKAEVYLTIGVEMEDVWLGKFKAQNNTLEFVDIGKGITKLEMLEHNHHEEHHHEEHHHHDEHNGEKEHHEEGLDPHIWTSPKNVKIIAKNIFEALVKIDVANKTFYKANLDEFIKEIEETDEKIKDILKDMKAQSKFMVFHPSWAYFAQDYNLVQIAVEVEGKKPKPKEMVEIIKEIKEEDIKVIFTQPEFSDKSAQVIAREANVRVKKLSALHPKWADNLINMARSIANK